MTWWKITKTQGLATTIALHWMEYSALWSIRSFYCLCIDDTWTGWMWMSVEWINLQNNHKYRRLLFWVWSYSAEFSLHLISIASIALCLFFFLLKQDITLSRYGQCHLKFYSLVICVTWCFSVAIKVAQNIVQSRSIPKPRQILRHDN